MRRVEELYRLSFLPLSILLFLGLAALSSLSFHSKIDTFRPTGVQAEQVLGRWLVVEVVNDATGLLPGDGIQLINGSVANNADEFHALLVARPTADIFLMRGDSMLQVGYERPPVEIDWAYLLLVAIGILYLLVGLYTIFKDRQSQARLFFFWCMTIGAVFLLSPILPPRDLADRWIYLVDQFARLLLPALTLHLFLVFPTALLSAARTRLAIPLAYVPTLFLAGFHLDQAFLGGLVFGPANAATLTRVDRLELILIVAFHLVAAASLIVRLGKESSWWEQKRQTQAMLFGLLAGYVPFLLLYLTPLSFGWSWPTWTTLIGVSAQVAVPLAFAYAILKHKLWDMEIILRDSISYSLAALVGVLGFSLINLVIQRQLADEQALMRNLLAFGAGLGIAGVMVPARNLIANRLEHWQYRGVWSSRRQLSELGQNLLLERDLDQLCKTLITGLSEGLGIIRANLYLSQESFLNPVKLGDGLPSAFREEELGEGFWEREVEGLSGVQLPGETKSITQQFFVAGYRYALPLTIRQQRIGIVLCSYKEGERPLNSEDLDLARNLLNQAALAIENARLLEKVHRQLEQVTELKEHNRGIIESSPAGLAVLDGEDRVISANHAFAAIAGVERPNLVNQPITTLIPVHPLPQPGDGLQEVSYCQLDGSERYLHISRAIYQGQSRSSMSILVVLDVTEQTALEIALKEKEQLASLGMLAAGVAHEVNTPITGISSYAQFLLADTSPNDPNYTILKKMEKQTFRASQIVNNLLEFARNRRQEFSAVDLKPLLEETAHLLADRAREAAVTIKGVPLDELPKVDGNESELHQVFTNLMVNAIDAMASQGGGRLILDTEFDDQSVRVRVVDSGSGIPPERLERIFQPFFSSKLDRGGTGLGLAITYNIVRRHGGEIWAKNHTDGPGCTFVVTLRRHLPPTK